MGPEPGLEDEDAEPFSRDRMRLVRMLAVAAFVPALVLLAWLSAIERFHPWRTATVTLLVGWGALVLAMLSGVRWGLSLKGDNGDWHRDMLVGCAALALGMVVLVVPPAYAFAVLAIAFAAHGAWDVHGVDRETVPQWYGTIRLQATFAAVAVMIGGFLATT